MPDLFHKIATKVSNAAGAPSTFLLAILIVLVWAITGPMFGFSDTWQLVINTGTTIITFLMVFLIQNTQNRDGKAVQLKLDELIRASQGARNEFVELERLSDEELSALDAEFQKLHDSQLNSLVMQKLHKTIEAEHKRRQANNLQHRAAEAATKAGQAAVNIMKYPINRQ